MKSIYRTAVWLLATWGAVAGADAQDWAALEESERLFHRGLSHFQGGEYESAVERFKESTGHRPAYFQSFYFLGVSYARLGDYEQGAAALNQALSLPSDSLPRFEDLDRAYFLPLRVDLAVAYYFLERYAEALDQLKEAERIDPANPYIHFYRGMCLVRTAVSPVEFQAAAEALQKAARLDPSLAQEAVRQAGLALMEGQRLEEAYNLLRSSEKRWQMHFGLGPEYDSNLVLEPEQGPFFGQLTEKDDFGFTFSAGAHYSFWQGSGGYLTAAYDFSQRLYAQADEFNLQGHTARLVAGRHFSPRWTVGAEGGLEHYRLGGESYLRQLYVQPFVGFFTNPRLYTLLSYRVDDSDYRIS
ncbi:MAG: tetratricopeptide repeat protein, partial [Acidobacteriota bacterium]